MVSAIAMEERSMPDQPDKLEPIAVTGYALKFPGDAICPDSFWRMMEERVCASSDFPKDRLNVDAFHSEDTRKQGTVSFHGGVD